MRSLVTGGAGFIGSNLTSRLARDGHEVTVLDDLSTGYRRNLENGVRFVAGDVRDARLVSDLVSQCDFVFHLAASVGNQRSIQDPFADSEINLLGTLTVLEAARKADIRRLVVSSSAGVFGELKQLPISEDHPTEPDTPYGTSKLAAEKMCLAYRKLHSLPVVCLRYFNVYGVNQRYDAYGNVIPIFVHRILRSEAIVIHGDGEQTRDFVNVGDAVSANIRAATQPIAGGVYNIGSGSHVSINELVRLLSEVSDRELQVTYGPPRDGDVRHSIADIGAARNDLGFEPEVELAAGLSEYFSWAEREAQIPA